MGYIIIVILAVIIFIILRKVSRKLLKTGEDKGIRGKERDEDHEDIRKELIRTGKILHVAAPVFLAIVVVSATLITSIHQVPAGHIGVVYEFKAIRGQITEGFQVIAPWRKVQIANVQVQSHKIELVAFSQETQDVRVKATLNIRVSPDAIQKLFREVGPNYFEIVVLPRVLQNFKDETVKYKSVDIAPSREPIRKTVRTRLEGELSSAYSIEVVDLLLDDVDFNPKFKEAIEKKQIATQNALEEQQRVAVEKYKADQAVEKAKGQGNSILVVAEKQAEANRKLSASLTLQLIQYTAIQKLSENVQVIMLPSGQNIILPPEVLKPGR